MLGDVKKLYKRYLVKTSVLGNTLRLIINKKKKITNTDSTKKKNIYTLFTSCTENQLY